MSALLDVRAVGKAFGGVVANRGISVQVEEGEIVGLIGPNGSGKTTLFNSIVGHHPIDEGEIYFDNGRIDKLGVPEIARLGLLRTFQQTRIYGGMTCVQNMLISAPQQGLGVAAMLAPHTRAEEERAGELLDFVGLYEKRHLIAGDLSDEQNHGCGILLGNMHAGAGIGGTGATGDETKARLTGHFAIGVRHHGGATFLTADGEPEIRCIVQGVQHGKVALTRHTKSQVCALGAQCIYQNLTTRTHYHVSLTENQ